MASILGLTLVALSLVFVAAAIRENWEQLATFRWSQTDKIPLAAAAGIYLASLLTTAAVWPVIMRGLGTRLEFGTALQLGLATQLGKYVPGSISHYLGRAALARRLSVTYAVSGLSTVIELTSAVTAAALIGFVALARTGEVAGRNSVGIGIIILGAVIGGIIVARFLASRQGREIPLIAWMGSMGLLCVSFVCAGASLYLLITSVADVTGVELLPIIGIYALSWVVGFLVPGAPAGLGVREALLIVFLGNVIGGPLSIIVAVLHRLMTTVVDAIAALLGISLIFYGRQRHLT